MTWIERLVYDMDCGTLYSRRVLSRCGGLLQAGLASGWGAPLEALHSTLHALHANTPCCIHNAATQKPNSCSFRQQHTQTGQAQYKSARNDCWPSEGSNRRVQQHDCSRGAGWLPHLGLFVRLFGGRSHQDASAQNHSAYHDLFPPSPPPALARGLLFGSAVNKAWLGACRGGVAVCKQELYLYRLMSCLVG